MKRWIVGFALHLLMCLAPAWAWAASYTFPGSLPAGCSGAGPSYTCGSLSLGWQDTLTINSPKPATITINGNLSTSENRINTAGSASDLTLNVTGTLTTNGQTRIVANVSVGSTATIGSQTQITGNVTGSSGLTTGSSAVITGNVSATGAATLGWQTRITGTTTAASVNCSGGACTFGGAVTANSGNALVGGQSTVTGNVVASVGHVATGSQTTVTGNVQAGGTLSMGSSSRITGNASSTGAATLAWQSRIDGTTNAASVACSDGACTFGGLITVTTGAVNLGGNSVVGNGIVSQSGSAITVGSSSQVTGNVVAQSSAVLTLGSGAQVSGCAMTGRTGSGSIQLNWNATAGGVCCSSGGSCLATSNGCYTNNSGKTITTAACTSLVAPSAVKIGSCTVAGVSSTYTTIQAGINAVASGGTVWICPGTYTELVNVNKTGLTVTSSTGNANDVIVQYASGGTPTATVSGSNVKLSALTINAQGGWHGVSLVGASPRLTGVKVISAADGPNSGTSAVHLNGASNVVIDGASTITTALGYGITNLYGSTSAIVNPTFSGLTVNAGARGIYLNNNVAGAVNLTNVNVTTTRWDAVRLESAGRVTHRIDRVTATANAGSGGDAWAFVLSNATRTGTLANITDSTFKSKATNINGYGGLSLSGISGGTMTGTEVESPVGPTFLYSNVTGMTFSGNVFRTTQTTNNYGTIWNYSGESGNTFADNCVFGVTADRLAYVRGDRLDNGSRGNYWSGHACGTPNASGICPNRYTSYGGARDNYPLSSCSAFTPIAACAYPVHAGGSLSVGKESEINGHEISGTGNAIDPNTGALTTATPTLGTLSPASFPAYSGGSTYTGSASSLVAGTTYSNVTLTGGTAPSGTYYINTLSITGNVTFAGGTFYVKAMSVSKELNVSLTTATDFRIGTSVDIDKGVDLLGTGAAANTAPARFYLYDNADFDLGKGGESEGRFDGIVVAPGSGSNITIGKEARITGALVTAGTISIGKESEITFNAAVQTALGGSGVCGGGTPPSTPPANFNCVEVGANAGSGHLYTKLVGTAFNFDVVALKGDGSIETSYASAGNKTVSVELVDGSGNTACASRSAISPAVSQTLSFAAADAGRKTAANMTVNKAYANLKCRAIEGGVMGCSSDSFAVRPTAMTVSSTANADATGASATATPVVKAGTDFSLSATAIAGYNGTPTLDAARLQAHAGATTSGTLSGSFAQANAASGVATGTTFKYSETGYFRYAVDGVIDTTFTAVDSANGDCSDDFSNSLVNGRYGCKFGNAAATNYFGRFIPDHFAIAPGTLTQGCGAFSYFGQDFTTAFTLTAQNASNATTYNYSGAFARLGLADWTGYAFSSPATLVSNGTTTTVTLAAGATPPTGSWNSGAASISATHKAVRVQSGALPAPANLTVKALPVDPDGVTLAEAAAVHANPALQRFGRLRLGNAYGSELLALPVPLVAQYWNGSGFINNPQDNCTALAAPTLTFHANNADNHLASGESTASYGHNPLLAGQAGLSLSAPGAGNFGYLDLSVATPDWLDYNWDGTATGGNLYEDDPRARAAFGKRRNAEKIIYRREVFLP